MKPRYISTVTDPGRFDSSGQRIRTTLTMATGLKPRFDIKRRRRLKFFIDEEGKRGLTGLRWKKDPEAFVVIEMLMPIYKHNQPVRVSHVLEKPFPRTSDAPDSGIYFGGLRLLQTYSIPEQSAVICLSFMPKLPEMLIREKGYDLHSIITT